MKILLTNNSLMNRGGSETWVATMFNHLRYKCGHSVDVYSVQANNLIAGTKPNPEKHYDLALINHNSCLDRVAEWDITKGVFTSHGVLPMLERAKPGADKYISVSEEVQTALKKDGFDSTIIRNPIDTDYFSPSPIFNKLTNILFLNNRTEMLGQVKQACKGFKLRILTGGSFGVKEGITWADLVITAGRGCYEALSCGKNVMVVNRNGSDGMVTEDNIFKLRKNNCSGRRNAFQWSAKEIRNELKKYDPTRSLREYILKHNNIDIAAQEYLA
jgi:hypothetical protein